ncbi:hypothetical protein DFH27DRAFT_579875, partial [Peziza echinospora]
DGTGEHEDVGDTLSLFCRQSPGGLAVAGTGPSAAGALAGVLTAGCGGVAGELFVPGVFGVAGCGAMAGVFDAAVFGGCGVAAGNFAAPPAFLPPRAGPEPPLPPRPLLLPMSCGDRW